MSRILVTGATGFIGRQISLNLLKEGHDVHIVIRKGQSYKQFPVPLKNVIAVDWPYELDKLPKNSYDFIVHCANAWETRDLYKAYQSNVVATELLAASAKKIGAHFIFLSSQSAHEDVGSLYAKTKMASEKVIHDLASNWTIIRPGLVYGEGASGLFGRIKKIVEISPVVPLIDGGKQTIQPIHVNSLAFVVSSIIAKPSKHNKKLYSLGDSNGISMKNFLRACVPNKNPLFLNVPSFLVSLMLRVADPIVQLPISQENLKGLLKIRFMDTKKDMETFGINVGSNEKVTGTMYRPLKGLIIGAGKMGNVHLHNMKDLPYASIVGIVDKEEVKAKMLAGFGKKIKTFTEVGEALQVTRPDFVLICTPTFTHKEVLLQCIKRGIHCFVEKPVALSEGECADIAKALHERPSTILTVGYFTSYLPHIPEAANKLAAGTFGKIKKVSASYQLSHIMDGKDRGWETTPALSGGGAIMNAGVHLLNNLRILFGKNVTIKNKTLLKRFSPDCEDRLEGELKMGGVDVSLVIDWGAQGFPTAENKITILTNKGELNVDNVGYSFIPHRGKRIVSSSDNSDISFNLSPESGGAGYSNELKHFFSTIINPKTDVQSLKDALMVENLARRLSDDN